MSLSAFIAIRFMNYAVLERVFSMCGDFVPFSNAFNVFVAGNVCVYYNRFTQLCQAMNQVLWWCRLHSSMWSAISGILKRVICRITRPNVNPAWPMVFRLMIFLQRTNHFNPLGWQISQLTSDATFAMFFLTVSTLIIWTAIKNISLHFHLQFEYNTCY